MSLDGFVAGPNDEMDWVFEHADDPPDDETDPAYTFVSGDVREATERAIAAADGRNVLVLGADVAGQCLREGVLDEALIHVLPVLLGDGVPLFRHVGGPVSMEMIESSMTGQVANLRYRARK
jgi:dihydrofolate reductase